MTDRMRTWRIHHGTVTGYSRGCSCVECRGAEAERQRARRATLRTKREAGEMPARSHGLYGYVGWGCRCDVCTAAMSKARRASERGAAARRTERSKPPDEGAVNGQTGG